MEMWQLIAVMFFIFSMTCIVLGFFALLKQKLYIDSKTNAPIEVSLPIIGKMKTNYPALIFVLIGFASMYPMYSMYETSSENEEDYLITGRLEVDQASITDENRDKITNLDFSTTTIVPFPSDVRNTRMEKNGTFSLTIKVPKTKEFEDQVQTLQLNGHPELIGSINTRDALNDRQTLIGHTQNSREYRFLVEATFPPRN